MVEEQGYKIVVDSREKTPLWDTDVVRKKLDVGDYSIEGYEDKISCERKSLPDLFLTLGSGNKRFKRELERAKSYDYFCIIIEGSLTSCLNKTFPGAKYSQMAGSTILSILCTLNIKYGVPFFFTNGREESRKLMNHIFKSYRRVYSGV